MRVLAKQWVRVCRGKTTFDNLHHIQLSLRHTSGHTQACQPLSTLSTPRCLSNNIKVVRLVKNNLISKILQQIIYQALSIDNTSNAKLHIAGCH